MHSFFATSLLMDCMLFPASSLIALFVSRDLGLSTLDNGSF